MAGAAAAGRGVAAFFLGGALVCFSFLSALGAFVAVVDSLGFCEAAEAFRGSCFWEEAFGGFGAEGALGGPPAESLIGDRVGSLEVAFLGSCFTGAGFFSSEVFPSAGFFGAEACCAGFAGAGFFSSEGLEAADGSEFADGLEGTEGTEGTEDPEDAPDS